MIELINVEKTYYSKAGDILRKAKSLVLLAYPVQANPLWFAASICWKDLLQARYLLTELS